ncbi:hypothetical protein J4403_04030 [Candidatus Woesearchaeota archaeon]|nr:hypothetical protein [Candidatus Woesearchaeota archaeon]
MASKNAIMVGENKSEAAAGVSVKVGKIYHIFETVEDVPQHLKDLIVSDSVIITGGRKNRNSNSSMFFKRQLKRGK